MFTPLERALVAHLVADWLLQDTWMATHKSRLTHPAAWVHGAIHGICLTLALDWQAGVFLGLLHVLVDTGVPVAWWMRVFKNVGEDPKALHVSIWTDQVTHVATIAAWIALFC